MIGLDTNILLRAVLDDDVQQSKLAREVLLNLSDENPGFVSIPVLLEFFWTLSSYHNVPKADALHQVRQLIEVQYITCENIEQIAQALYWTVNTGAGFIDALVAALNKAHGCTHTVTFDKKAARDVSEMELLT